MSERMDVRQVAQGRWRSILTVMGLDERTLSDKHGPCPMCGGKDRFRFDDKEGRGTYYCSGCGAGDGLSLAMGITGMSFRDVALEVERIAGTVASKPLKAERTVNDKLSALRRVFKESKPIEREDDAYRYLVGRGLALSDLPMSVRTHPSLAYYDGGTKVGTYPAIVATVTDSLGQPLTLHRTYLHEGRKAPVPAPKKLMQGEPLAGAAIRLTAVSRSIGIAEGIETALAASEMFEVPVWSCISTIGIESFEPPEGVEHVIIFADNDENFAGQSAAYRAANRLKLKGLDVEVVVPPRQGDWLDELNRIRGQGRGTIVGDPTFGQFDAT